ncbi:1,2-phenylacetyl-CoA epoxidase subunit PaaC [Risungbinella massiliensis]|uniref:1,2-phenylacetyl-CoA epoxidase subunit PaaC n=1 Tax=Risungbinella massiliensis TaxID=1329796 RepID=UPI0005CC767E|nr:1,2-phenylacetyl-CoA epoxidase subunit PaaC [Risungbinella massiliensis]
MNPQYYQAQEALQNSDYSQSLKELLYQLADDDFLLAYRGSEWLGLAPHIEEDVAFSSISQDTMGHAVLFYEMLEELGEGKADDLAQLRSSEEFRNAILLERPNGPGDYIKNPSYDWSFCFIRTYFYELYKLVRLQSLESCSYQPLAFAATKIQNELLYHLYHWQVWMRQLLDGGAESRERILQAIERVWVDSGDLIHYGNWEKEFLNYELIEPADVLADRWKVKIQEVLVEPRLVTLAPIPEPKRSGRRGEHTEDLKKALAILSEVYRLDPAASW